MAAAYDPLEPPGGYPADGPDGASLRRHQRMLDLCAASLRAHTGVRDLHFRAGRLHRGELALPIFGPHLVPSPGQDDLASLRGAADAMALRLRHSDAALHRRLCPTDPAERWVCEMLEQCRVESLADAQMAGMLRNLRHRFDTWSTAFHDAGGTETARGLLLYTVAQVARSRVTGQPVTEATEDLLEATRAGIVPAIGHDLAGLRRARHDQAAYASHARRIAQFVVRQLAQTESEADANATPTDNRARLTRERRIGLLLDFDADVDDGIARLDSDGGRASATADGADYRVFTRAFDREVHAATLVRHALLVELRHTLDQRLARLGVNLGPLARRFKALLADPHVDGWDDGQEEGRLDARRLARLVSTPAERRVFRSEHQAPVADAVVGLLIDCSGSMRRHIDSLTLLVDLLVRVLDMAGVATEVLGFTTGAWHGGRVWRAWQRAGRPPHPGRLNEVLHLVFKDADTPWRRARRDLSALLKADNFREGIDGEAVDWAGARLQAVDARRRVLLVFSDGCPMDTATHQANSAHYLDQHLREVVARHEREGVVQVIGVGVGLDLSPYYRRSLALDLRTPPGARTLGEIASVIGQRR